MTVTVLHVLYLFDNGLPASHPPALPPTLPRSLPRFVAPSLPLSLSDEGRERLGRVRPIEGVRDLMQGESGPLRAVHLSRLKWPGG